MKINKLLVGLGMVALMSACSNDEPVPTPGNEADKPAGTQTMLQVNIKATDSRADEYAYGSPLEHEVLNASFFFFDADGIYVGKGEKWSGGTDGSTPNVEYLGKNVIVLDDQESNTYPKYVLTLLNAQGFTPKSTLAATSTELVNWAYRNGEKDAFLMSTSSFFGSPSAEEAKHYEDTYYYVTVLDSSDFIKYNPEKGELPNITNATPVVDIYVERLAAKVEVTFGTDGKNYETTLADNSMIFNTDVTIMGEVNDGEEGGAVATTPLYVRVYGWDLSATVADSYLSKQLMPEWNTTAPWTGWNKAADYRSFWAQSTVYGKDAPALAFKDWNSLSLSTVNTAAAGVTPTNVAYCNENTNLVENVTKTVETTNEAGQTVTELVPDASKITSVMLKAQLVVKNEAGEYVAVKGVRYNGAIFTDDRYKNYLLDIIANTAEGLNIWKGVYEEGSTTPVSYTQIDANSVKFELVSKVLADNTLNTLFTPADYADLAGTGKVLVIADLAEGTYFARGDQKTNEDGTPMVDAEGNPVYNYTQIANPANALNTLLADNQKGRKVESFDGGLYYTIPVQHEVSATLNGQAATGYYGVVRNHWYKVNIKNIVRIGHGVFNPGSDDEPGEPLIPDEPENPRYYVAANINILSWKLVNQDVEL